MTYTLLLTLHLVAAVIFIGTVVFEVLILEGIRRHLPKDMMRTVEIAIGDRARTIMPWVLLVLFLAGIAMAWNYYRVLLAAPLNSSLGFMLWIKIILAVSVLGHFITAMTLRRRGLLHSRHFRFIHRSVLTHMVVIVLLAKWMFFLA